MNRFSTFAFLLAAGLAAATPAFAQSSAPVPMNGRSIEVGSGTPVDGSASGLPGVNLDTSTSGRDRSPRGPGGMQNGIGAYGVMTPDAGGSAGNTLTRVPGAIPDTNSGLGIPIGTPGAPAN